MLLVAIPGTSKRVEPSAGASLARAVSAGCPAGGINDAYRSYAEQVTMFLSRYRVQMYGRGIYGDVRWWNGKRYVRTSGLGMAARPGTSTHGDGLAIDFAYPQRTWMFAHGTAYGWFNTIRSEPWHWEYRATRDTHKGDTMSAASIRDAVWARPVTRSGKNVTAIQELADAKTEGIKANGKLDALLTAVKGLSTPTVDAGDVAAALAKNTTFHAALAKAVNDDAAKRRAQWS